MYSEHNVCPEAFQIMQINQTLLIYMQSIAIYVEPCVCTIIYNVINVLTACILAECIVDIYMYLE